MVPASVHCYVAMGPLRILMKSNVSDGEFASLPLRETPPGPHHNHNSKTNSRDMVLEFCMEVL